MFLESLSFALGSRYLLVRGWQFGRSRVSKAVTRMAVALQDVFVLP